MKNNISKFIITFIAIIPLLSLSQTKTEKATLLNGKVEFNSPTELTKMSNEIWNTKYPNRPKPILTLSDENGEVNLIGDITNQPVLESQLDSYKDFQISSLKRNHPELIVLNRGVKTINGKKTGFFKFTTEAIVELDGR